MPRNQSVKNYKRIPYTITVFRDMGIINECKLAKKDM